MNTFFVQFFEHGTYSRYFTKPMRTICNYTPMCSMIWRILECELCVAMFFTTNTPLDTHKRAHSGHVSIIG